MEKTMSNAEMMIRKDIDNLSAYRLAPTKLLIEQDIKYAYWHEFICIDTYNELMKLVNEKYCNVVDTIIS